MERSENIIAMKISYYCYKCKDQEMVFTGMMLLSYPPQFVHKCNSCGKMINLDSKYPYLKYKDQSYNYIPKLNLE